MGIAVALDSFSLLLHLRSLARILRHIMDYDICLTCGNWTRQPDFCNESCRLFDCNKPLALTQPPGSISTSRTSSFSTSSVQQAPAAANMGCSALAAENLRAYNKMLGEGNGYRRLFT